MPHQKSKLGTKAIYFIKVQAYLLFKHILYSCKILCIIWCYDVCTPKIQVLTTYQSYPPWLLYILVITKLKLPSSQSSWSSSTSKGKRCNASNQPSFHHRRHPPAAVAALFTSKTKMGDDDDDDYAGCSSSSFSISKRRRRPFSSTIMYIYQCYSRLFLTFPFFFETLSK